MNISKYFNYCLGWFFDTSPSNLQRFHKTDERDDDACPVCYDKGCDVQTTCCRTSEEKIVLKSYHEKCLIYCSNHMHGGNRKISCLNKCPKTINIEKFQYSQKSTIRKISSFLNQFLINEYLSLTLCNFGTAFISTLLKRDPFDVTVYDQQLDYLCGHSLILTITKCKSIIKYLPFIFITRLALFYNIKYINNGSRHMLLKMHGIAALLLYFYNQYKVKQADTQDLHIYENISFLAGGVVFGFGLPLLTKKIISVVKNRLNGNQ